MLRGGSKIPLGGAFRDPEGCGDFVDRHPFVSQLTGAFRLGLRRSASASLVDPPFLGGSDADGLAFPASLLFHLGHGEEDRCNQLADRPGKIELLRHADDADATVDPIAEGVDAVPERSREPVEFPEHDRFYFAIEDVSLQLPKGRPVQVVSRGLIAVPADVFGIDAVSSQPALDFAALPGFVLTSSRDSDVAGDAHCSSFRADAGLRQLFPDYQYIDMVSSSLYPKWPTFLETETRGKRPVFGRKSAGTLIVTL